MKRRKQEKTAVLDIPQPYTPGNWLVHKDHGIGRVEKIEVKKIGKHTNTYCRIATHNSTIWVPVENLNEEWFRPVASKKEVRRAMEVLEKPPKTLPDNINSRKSLLRKLKLHHAPAKIAKMIRDLWARKKEKKTLSTSETSALQYLTDNFVAEVAVAMDISPEEAEERLNSKLS